MPTMLVRVQPVQLGDGGKRPARGFFAWHL